MIKATRKKEHISVISIFFKDVKSKIKSDRATGWNASGDLHSYTWGACGYIISFQIQVYLDMGTDSHNAVVTEKKLWKRLLLIKICKQDSSCVTESLWSSRPHSCQFQSNRLIPSLRNNMLILEGYPISAILCSVRLCFKNK